MRKYVIALLMAIALMMNAHAISVSMSSGSGGSQSTTDIQTSLDKSTAFKFEAMAKDGNIVGQANADGSGTNEIVIRSDDYVMSARSPVGGFGINMQTFPGYVAGNAKIVDEEIKTSDVPGAILSVDMLLTDGQYAGMVSGNVPWDGTIRNAYTLKGNRWKASTLASPKIKLEIKADNIWFPAMRNFVWRSMYTVDYFTPKQMYYGQPTQTSTGNPGTQDGRNIIQMKPGGNVNVLGTTFTWAWDRDGFDDIFETDYVLNADQPWSLQTIAMPGFYDFQSVMTHELMHGIGVGGTTPEMAAAFPGQVMNENLQTGVLKQNQLGIGDYNALNDLYGGNYGRL